MDKEFFRKLHNYLEEVDSAVKDADVANRRIYNKVADLYDFINYEYIMGEDHGD